MVTTRPTATPTLRAMGTLSRRRAAILVVAALILAAVLVIVVAGAGASSPPAAGEIGPAYHITGNGHVLHPVGKLVTVGDFPDGSAVTPNGKDVWIVDCGHGIDDARIINVKTAKQIETLALPGCYGGVSIAPDGLHAYISGEPLAGNPTDGPTMGDAGDVIHVYTINPSTGMATEQTPLTIPATTGGTARTNSLPPVSGVGTEYPEGMAVSPDGKYLVVALNGADRADVVNLQDNAQTTVKIGEYPVGVAFDPQGRAYVTNEYSGTVSVINPATATVTATIGGIGGSRGDLASHPEGLVADPKRNLLYVAVTDRDLVDVVNTTTDKVVDYVSVGRPQGLGTEPTSVAISPDDSTLYSSDAGEDALAAISLNHRPARALGHRIYVRPTIAAIRRYLKSHAAKLVRPTSRLACAGPTKGQIATFVKSAESALRGPGPQQYHKISVALKRLPRITLCKNGFIPNLPAYRLIGRIPTAAYPDSVSTTSTGQLIWVSGKGYGSGPNPTYHFGGSPLAPGQTPTNAYGTYVLDLLIGRVGITPVLTDKEIVSVTPQADRQLVPYDSETQPAGSPVPASFGHPSTQIKHVFYIVKENRTYDQIFGSEGSHAEGDPSLEVFDNNGVSGPTGGVTPNAHALTSRFPLFDNFYEDSEVSVDGHVITAGAESNDYVQKATAANYSGRRGTYDLGIWPVTFPPNFFIFDQAAKQNISYEDYGEAVGTLPFSQAPNRPEYANVAAHVDEAYPNNLFIGCLKAGVLPSCTQDSGVLNNTGTLYAGQSRFDIWLPTFQAQVAAGTVPTFNYMILPEDHTNGTTVGDPTPQAMVADNDLGLGQIVDAISHSKIWSSSAIFVVEDDSQDGADHIDSHRAPAYVISPWARQSGFVDPTRYDQYSVLKTIELITGIEPLELNDALATPMYDAFISGNEKPDDAPYTAIQPTYSLKTLNTASSPDAKLSSELPWNQLDQVPQAISDQILWQSVFGARSTPPPAGPNASPEEVQRAVAMRRLLTEAHPKHATTSTRRWTKQSRCPISWACLKVPTGTS
jgi:YVTN family beta-propeller protein